MGDLLNFRAPPPNAEQVLLEIYREREDLLKSGSKARPLWIRHYGGSLHMFDLLRGKSSYEDVKEKAGEKVIYEGRWKSKKTEVSRGAHQSAV